MGKEQNKRLDTGGAGQLGATPTVYPLAEGLSNGVLAPFVIRLQKERTSALKPISEPMTKGASTGRGAVCARDLSSRSVSVARTTLIEFVLAVNRSS